MSLVLGAVLVVTLVVSCVSMGRSIDFSFVLASPMEGRLVDKDLRPVPNARVERSWHWFWNGRKGSDVTTTDAQGRFAFPRVTRRSLTAGVLPHETMIEQSVTAVGPSGPVELVTLTKRDYENNSEGSGKPLSLICRIDLKPGPAATGFWGTVIEVR